MNHAFASPIPPLLEDAHAMIGEARAIQPGWTDRIEALALEWGQHLYVALDVLRLGEDELAAEGADSLIETLGELNVLLQAIPGAADGRAVAMTAIADVAELMRDKLGRLSPRERLPMLEFMNTLVLKVGDRDVLTAAGRTAFAPELRAQRTQRALRKWGRVLLPVGAAGACAATLLFPAPWPALHAVQYITAGLTVFAAGKFVVASRNLGRQIVPQPTDQDINYVLAPVTVTLQFFSAPARAATPSAVSPAG